MADSVKPAWFKVETEMLTVGVNHDMALALFTGISIVVWTFGDK